MPVNSRGTTDDKEWTFDWLEKKILNEFGDTVSFDAKLKELVKFGENPALGTTPSTIMTLPGSETEETYVNRNLITHASSSDAGDTSTVYYEGHTVGSDISISSMTQAAGVATVTTGTAHGLSVNDWVTIEGANETEYNGIVQVQSVPTTTTFTITVDSGATTPATGTLVTAAQIKTFFTDSFTLQGTTKVALPTPCARSTRGYIPEQDRAVLNAGDIYFYEDDTLTAGVPDTDSKVHLIIPAGVGQSEKASSTISNTDYYAITGIIASVSKKAAGFADIEPLVRRLGGVFRPATAKIAVAAGDTVLVPFKVPIIVPKNADFIARGTASASSTPTAVTFIGYLGKVIG